MTSRVSANSRGAAADDPHLEAQQLSRRQLVAALVAFVAPGARRPGRRAA